MHLRSLSRILFICSFFVANSSFAGEKLRVYEVNAPKNCLDKNISVITNIGYDHMQSLGNTLEEDWVIPINKGF